MGGRGFEALAAHLRRRNGQTAPCKGARKWVRLPPSSPRKGKPKDGDGTGFETRRGSRPWEFDPPSFRSLDKRQAGVVPGITECWPTGASRLLAGRVARRSRFDSCVFRCSTCPGGETGKRTGLRSQRLRAWGFEAPLGHCDRVTKE